MFRLITAARVPSLLVALAAIAASCDLYFPDHRLVIEGHVRDAAGAGLPGVDVALRRGRLRYDTPLASTQTDGAGAYRLAHRLEGCSGLFDTFAVVAERRVGADTLRVREPVACADSVQTVDLVVGDLDAGVVSARSGAGPAG